MKKNILLVIPFLGYTGAERVIFTLLNNLDRMYVNPHLLIFSDDNERNSLLKHLKGDVKVSVVKIEGRLRYNIHNIAVGIKKTCKKYDIDSVLISDGSTNAILAPFLGFIGKKGVKYIARESNLPSIHEKNKVIRALYRAFYKKYDVIVAQSDDMVNDLSLKMNVPSEKITKINNPLDYPFIKLSLEQDPEFLLPREKINLLAIGRLTYQKGFDILLNAFYKLADVENYHLTIIGSGEELCSLQKLIIDLNLSKLVTLIPKVDNPYAIMKQADVLVSSSRWEGYPNVVIESIACGLPVLSNKYPGGINEIITSGNGIICDITSEFKESLEKVLSLRGVSLDVKYNQSIFNSYLNIF